MIIGTHVMASCTCFLLDVLSCAIVSGAIGPDQSPCLCCPSAGTGLGDPIEAGAIAAVFTEAVAAAMSSAADPATERRGRVGHGGPLTLLASKSWVGHAEPAAGVVGLAFAQVNVSGCF